MKWTLEMGSGEKMTQQDFDRHCAGFALLAGCTFVGQAPNVAGNNGSKDSPLLTTGKIVAEKQTTFTEDDVRTAMRKIFRNGLEKESFTLCQAFDASPSVFKWCDLLPKVRQLIGRRIKSFCDEQGYILVSEDRKVKKLTVYRIVSELDECVNTLKQTDGLVDGVKAAEPESAKNIAPVDSTEKTEQL